MTRINEGIEIQEKQINIQGELKDLTKQIHTTTKRHYIVMWVLTAIIAGSAFATLFCNYCLDKTGRYVMGPGDATAVYVLDTKTSRLWMRTIDKKTNFDLGTNENPKGVRKEK